MLTRYFKTIAVTIAAPLILIGCGTTGVPDTLAGARVSYEEATESQTAQLAQAELDLARQALEKANALHAEKEDTEKVTHWAYVADRRVKIANTVAAHTVSERNIKATNKEKTAVLEAAAKGARSKLASKDSTISNLDSTITNLDAKVDKERDARIAAERKAEQAMAALKKALKVAENARGLVITMAGEVLFATGKSELRHTAYSKLDPLVSYLKANPARMVVVEGHTDSQGGDAANMTLSRARAESVRSYLVSKGVPANQVTALGLGEGRPIASNKNATGRANNRRVEIIVKPAPVSTSSGIR